MEEEELFEQDNNPANLFSIPATYLIEQETQQEKSAFHLDHSHAQMNIQHNYADISRRGIFPLPKASEITDSIAPQILTEQESQQPPIFPYFDDHSGINYYRKMQMMEKQQEEQKKALQESFETNHKYWLEERKNDTHLHSQQLNHFQMIPLQQKQIQQESLLQNQLQTRILNQPISQHGQINQFEIQPNELEIVLEEMQQQCITQTYNRDDKILSQKEEEGDRDFTQGGGIFDQSNAQQQQNENESIGNRNEYAIQIKDEKNQSGSINASELAFEEFAFTEKVFSVNDKNTKQNESLVVKYILHNTLQPIEAFLINGEIILSFDIFDRRKDKEHNKVSLWNMFRPINQILVKKKLIEISLHKSQGVMNDFQPLIQRLMSMQDQQAYKSAQMLQQHYQSLQEEQALKSQVFEVYQSRITHLQWQLEENFHLSKEMAYSFMEQLPEDAFFLYSIRRTDPISLDSIFCTLGYSKALIRLIAGNETNYQQFCFRSGLAEIFNYSSRLEILLMNLLFSNKVEISITTLDDYTIPIEMRVHYQKLVPTEILPGVFKEDYMKIYQILIDTKYIDEITRLRGSEVISMSTNISSSFMSIVQPNVSYQESVSKFLDKFYSETIKDKNQGNNKKNPVNSKDPNNFSAVFQRIFGNQNEGQNYLTSVFNTKVTQPNIKVSNPNLNSSVSQMQSGQIRSPPSSASSLSASQQSQTTQGQNIPLLLQSQIQLGTTQQQPFQSTTALGSSALI